MAVEVVPYGLLELMIRRPLLEPLVEKVSQVLVEPSSCRKCTKQTEDINKRGLSEQCAIRPVCESSILQTQPETLSYSEEGLPFPSAGDTARGRPQRENSMETTKVWALSHAIPES